MMSFLLKSAARNFWLLIFILSTCISAPAKAQTGWKFSNFPNHSVRPVAETYDGGVLLLIRNAIDEEAPSYLLKVTLNKEILWSRQLNNLLYIFDAIATTDSGFAIAVDVNMFPGTPLNLDARDSVQKAAILKFDKCGNLEWGRFLSSNYHSSSINMIGNKNGEIALCAVGVNGRYAFSSKLVTIAQFDVEGNLINFKSFGGITGKLTHDVTGEKIILTQEAYLPIKEDTTSVYLFPTLMLLDNDLEISNRNAIGYNEKIYSKPGPTFIFGKEVIHVSSVALKDGSIMFTTMDQNLNILSDFAFKTDSTYSLIPAFASALGDSMLIAYWFRPRDEHQWLPATSLRLYDAKFNLLKEVQINKDYTQVIINLLPLKNSDKFIVGITDAAATSTDTVIGLLYLLDRNLNFKSWTAPTPVKGYDWACPTTIPYLDTINVNEAVEPVYVPIDSTPPDWSWIYTLGIEEQENNARVEKGWIIYPQPCAKNSNLHIRADLNKAPGLRITHIRFYDLSGRMITNTEAVSNTENQWTVQTSNLPHSGIYIAELLNGEMSIGRVKVVVL